MSGRRGIRRAAVLASASLLLVAVPGVNVASAVEFDGPKLARNLTKAVTLEGVNRHLIALQRIADRNGGNRARVRPVTTPAWSTWRASCAAPGST